MKFLTTTCVFLIGLICVPTLALPVQKVKPCVGLTETIQQMTEQGQNVSIEALPKKLLVASRIEMFVQSNAGSTQAIQFWAQHSFLNAKSSFKCFSASEDFSQSFVTVAPTLLDFTELNKVGNSFWQFHISIEKNKLGIWNQKTRLFPNQKKWQEELRKSGYELDWKKLENGQYRLSMVKQSEAHGTQFLVYFDVTKNN